LLILFSCNNPKYPSKRLSDNLRSRWIGQERRRNRAVVMSFPRRRESSIIGLFWTPACAGVTIERRPHLPI
jgi:hypothetical protein